MNPGRQRVLVIFQFARLMRSTTRELPAIEEASADAPPEQFVSKLSDEGGDVYVAPVLESLREALRRRREDPAPADPSPDAPEQAPLKETPEVA